jgi:hypothetical protein
VTVLSQNADVTGPHTPGTGVRRTCWLAEEGPVGGVDVGLAAPLPVAGGSGGPTGIRALVQR